MEDYNDNDISWLTQVQSLESQKADFRLINNENSDEEFDDIFGLRNDVETNIVSLEENADGKYHLYDNVVVENISSDEELEKV